MTLRVDITSFLDSQVAPQGAAAPTKTNAITCLGTRVTKRVINISSFLNPRCNPIEPNGMDS